MSCGITNNVAIQTHCALPRFAGKRALTEISSPAVATTTPTIARLVLNGPPRPASAREILSDALAVWPIGGSARYLITPGGFAEADWPKAYEGEGGWLAGDSDIHPLVTSARLKLSEVVTPEVLQRARGKVDFLSIGIDVVGDKGLRGPHAELVAVVNVNTGNVEGWTGKSYPTATQENHLVPVTDLDSHFMTLGKDHVMVLGCQDLNMFSPRVQANQKPGSPREQRSTAMLEKAEAFKPDIILQHPHATDTPNTWRMAWTAVERLFPELTAWASGIRYFNTRGANRAPLTKVLNQTRSDETAVQDIVVDTTNYPPSPSYMNAVKAF